MISHFAYTSFQVPQSVPAFSPDDISNLVLWYDISNVSSYPGSGTTIYDLKQVRNASYRDASIIGTYSYNAAGGYISKGGGANDRIEMSSSSSYPLTSTNNWSISMWVYITAYYGTYSRIFRTGNTTNGNHVTLGRYNGGNNYALYNKPGWYDTGVATTYNTWMNLTFTYSSSHAYVLYKDGSSISSGTMSNSSGTNPYLFMIMGTNNSEVTQGYFGAGYVYDKVLSPTEVSELYEGTNRY